MSGSVLLWPLMWTVVPRCSGGASALSPGLITTMPHYSLWIKVVIKLKPHFHNHRPNQTLWIQFQLYFTWPAPTPLKPVTFFLTLKLSQLHQNNIRNPFWLLLAFCVLVLFLFFDNLCYLDITTVENKGLVFRLTDRKDANIKSPELPKDSYKKTTAQLQRPWDCYQEWEVYLL